MIGYLFYNCGKPPQTVQICFRKINYFQICKAHKNCACKNDKFYTVMYNAAQNLCGVATPNGIKIDHQFKRVGRWITYIEGAFRSRWQKRLRLDTRVTLHSFSTPFVDSVYATQHGYLPFLRLMCIIAIWCRFQFVRRFWCCWEGWYIHRHLVYLIFSPLRTGHW